MIIMKRFYLQQRNYSGEGLAAGHGILKIRIEPNSPGDLILKIACMLSYNISESRLRYPQTRIGVIYCRDLKYIRLFPS